MYNVSTMYNVQPCPYIYIYMSVYVYEYGYVCRIMSGICAYTHEYTDIHTCVYMCVYAQCMCTNFSTPTETGREAHLVQGTASLSADGPVSVPRFSHASACSFRNSAVMASPGSGPWKSDSQHLSQPEPAFALETPVCQAVAQADRHQAVLSLVTVTVFALPNQGDSVCSSLHSCSVPQFTAEHIWLVLQR